MQRQRRTRCPPYCPPHCASLRGAYIWDSDHQSRVSRYQRELAMSDIKYNTALIVGAGAGLSASLARALAKEGIKVALAARSTGDLDALTKETGAKAFACDASKRGEVDKLFADVD